MQNKLYFARKKYTVRLFDMKPPTKTPLLSDDLRVKLIGLFIALSLSVTYYYLIKPWAMGTPGNSTNFWVFSAMAHTDYHLHSLYPAMRLRVAGLWLSGRLVDSIVSNGHIKVADVQTIFGLYQACWLFLFFVMVLFLVEEPVFIILGCFGAMFYMFTPGAQYYFYPWDMPGMLFFTLNYLLWRRKRYLLMLAVMFIGTFFKETVILTGVLFFFTDLTKGQKIRYLAAAAAIAVFTKIGLTLAVDGKISFFTNQFTSGQHKGFLENSTIFKNVKELITPNLNHFIFVNGGTFIVSLLLPMRTKVQKGTKAVLGIFSLAVLLGGVIHEFRIMLDILPISVLAIREYLVSLNRGAESSQISAKRSSLNRGKMSGT